MLWTCRAKILPLLLQSVFSILSDLSGSYSRGGNELTISLLTRGPAELEAVYLFRLSQANRTRIRIWIADKGAHKRCPRLSLPEASADIQKHFWGDTGKAVGEAGQETARNQARMLFQAKSQPQSDLIGGPLEYKLFLTVCPNLRGGSGLSYSHPASCATSHRQDLSACGERGARNSWEDLQRESQMWILRSKITQNLRHTVKLKESKWIWAES